jgi:hypothetical protein
MELGLQWLEQRPQPGLLFAAAPIPSMSLADVYALLNAGVRRSVPDVGGADGALSSEWDDAVRLLVGFPDSDTAVRVAECWVEG